MVAATAIVLSLLTSTSDVLHAHFDGAQSGDLPGIVVDRPMAALQSDGTAVDANQPRWGRPRATPGAIAGWTQVVDAPGSITLLLSGFDADDTTPLLGKAPSGENLVLVDPTIPPMRPGPPCKPNTLEDRVFFGSQHDCGSRWTSPRCPAGFMGDIALLYPTYGRARAADSGLLTRQPPGP